MPGTIVGTQDTSVNKEKEDPNPQGAYILAGRRQEIIDIINKQIIHYISGGNGGYRKISIARGLRNVHVHNL